MKLQTHVKGKAALVCLTLAGILMTPALAIADPVFGTMNDGGGVYWRAAPDWNTPAAQPGNGHYPGTRIAVSCFASGGAVPGSANTMWVRASWVSGPGHGSGYINEHMVNDGAPINQAAAGIPPCVGGTSGGNGGHSPVSCRGSSCTGKDPGATGCGADARQLDAFSAGGYAVQLRYSSSCDAAWTRIVGGDPSHTCNGWTDGYLAVMEGSTNKRDEAAFESLCAVGGSSYTAMVNFRLWVRACLYYQPDYDGGNPRPVRCTTWH